MEIRFQDTLRVIVTGGDIPLTLRRIAESGIPVRDLNQQDEITVIFTIFAGNLHELNRILDKRGDTMTVQTKSGLRAFLWRLLHRKLLITGLLFLLLLSLYLPERILFLRVEGNHRIPAREILTAAENCGVSFGVSREEIRSERMKNSLLEQIPGLQWAGINTQGCVGIISVRERTETEADTEESSFGHIVAIRDGVIDSCSATRGNLLCAPGDAVTEGQILISGYTDCGLTIRAEQAEGEVYGMTRRSIQVITPGNTLEKVPSGEESKKISLLFGKKRIILWKDSGIWDTTCDRMYEEYYVTLPGGFVLPIALCVERSFSATLTPEAISGEELEPLLKATAARYLNQQMAAGTIRREHTVFLQGDAAELTGEYVCMELIGKMQRDKIGENDAQDD